MAGHILMLEDDAGRLERFGRVLAKLAPSIAWIHWREAMRMIQECEPYLSTCRLICLDHDLDLVRQEDGMLRDAGDGLEVARYLAPLKLGCPVLIHSSNGDGARRMMGEFELCGWNAQAMLPLGVGWIEKYWREKVRALFGRCV